MKHTLTLIAVLLLGITAQSGINKQILSSVVTITTHGVDSSPLGRAWGFVIPNDSATANGCNTIVAPYSLFKHATSGTITDANRKNHDVYRISGANDLYDVTTFTVKDGGLTPMTIAAQKLKVGDRGYILTGITDHKKLSAEATITAAEEHGGLTYYTLSLKADTNMIGTPLLNASGEVVGIIQQSAAKEADKMYAVGIEIRQALTIETMAAANSSLNNIFIAKQLPRGEKEASSYLYLLTRNSQDTLSYLTNLGDFISAYPNSTFGYTQRALYYASTQQYDKAEKDYDTALASCQDKADIHYNISTTLYLLNQDKAYKPYKDWTLDRSLSEINKAYEIFNTPLYLTHKGKVLYAMKKYMDAYDTYKVINQTKFRSSENLFFQSRSLQMAGGDSTQVLALLDSAVMRFKQPYKPDAAAYIYYRAQQYDRYGHYKEAVVGYQDYQDIVGIKNLSDRFFYLKEQAEIKCNFYPQALADIEQAISLNPTEYVYYIQKALIETRTANYEEAVIAAKQAQQIDNTDPDSYKLMGIAYGELGNTAEARRNLQRAVELGDAEAQSWLDNMKSATSRKASAKKK